MVSWNEGHEIGIDIEGIRLGVEVQAAPIDMATWADPPPTSPALGRLTWHALCPKGAASSVTADGPVKVPSGAPA